ncbi:MAG TPA: UvrD-helicase domain-containing protein [Microvirga sp.]|jgi:ATP-dependent exoDNAse (exonuclease V) beta subunit
MAPTTLNPVDTTLASAGTGKTTAVIAVLAEAIDGGTPPERILGTTFTVKAAHDLVERARQYLLDRGKVEEATRLLQARLGTINSVCGRLVGEFALDLGRSPAIEVIPEDAVKDVFAVSADAVLAEFAPALNALADALGLADCEVDWRDEVRRIIELARANGIDPDALPASSDRSVATLLALVPDPGDEDEASLDRELAREVDETLSAIEGVSFGTTSAPIAEAVRSAGRILSRGDQIPWPLWATLAKAKSTKGDAPYFAGVSRAASAHPRHPRLRRDLERFVRTCFDCAGRAFAAYQAHKAERGLVDFVDQEALALEILRNPAARERLRESIDLVLIDEVQDASPLQIAIFTELARVAPRSVWVGDPKQSIYGFRSTDANLTLAASRGVAEGTGGTSGVLSRSWRSRPGICRFVNDAFVPAFEATGLPAESCRFTDLDVAEDPIARPALNVWHLTGKNKPDHAASLAGGVAEILANADDWPTRPRIGGTRAVRPGDIAVLCRDKKDVAEVATALSALGIPVSVDRGDLFAEPEVEVVVASLRWIADRRDRPALALMARLLGGAEAPSAWLDAVVAADPDAELAALVPFADMLARLRDRQMGMTPCEVVDAVILAAGLVDLACRWGDPAARLAALEAFRGVACSYEEKCRRLGAPATLVGLVGWLADQKAAKPRAKQGTAVEVMTYHKAKGLEWPVVLLTQLEKAPRSDLFRPTVEVDGDIDWRDPLARRWIRHWPWPYGKHGGGVGIDGPAETGSFGGAAKRRAREEAVRLLYVGVTRARDHLVLARTNRDAAWLSALDVGPDKHVSLPAHDGNPIRVGGREHPARVAVVRPGSADDQPGFAPVFLGLERTLPALRPLRLNPSAANENGAYVESGRDNLGTRMPIVGSPDMGELGQAIHSFLASDRIELDSGARRERAQVVLRRWGMEAHLGPASLVEASDRLRSYLAVRFPAARLRHEVPVNAVVGKQVIVGRVDLLVEWGDGFVVVDHKSFPGREEIWGAKAASYGPQLALYAQAVQSVLGKRCEGLLVHMPVVGAVVELAPKLPADEVQDAG